MDPWDRPYTYCYNKKNYYVYSRGPDERDTLFLPKAPDENGNPVPAILDQTGQVLEYVDPDETYAEWEITR